MDCEVMWDTAPSHAGWAEYYEKNFSPRVLPTIKGVFQTESKEPTGYTFDYNAMCNRTYGDPEQ
jgi:hypothetical protein